MAHNGSEEAVPALFTIYRTSWLPVRPGAALGAGRESIDLNKSRDRLPTYLIGRSSKADVVLGDSTVSRLHAELVRATDGAWYLTDRGSSGGTYLRDAKGWTPVRQEFVRPGDRLKFGGFECSVDELLRRISSGEPGASRPGDGPPGSGSPIRDNRPAGPVLRDPVTGEVISAEDE